MEKHLSPKDDQPYVFRLCHCWSLGWKSSLWLLSPHTYHVGSIYQGEKQFVLKWSYTSEICLCVIVTPASRCSVRFSLFGFHSSVPCCCTPIIGKGLGRQRAGAGCLGWYNLTAGWAGNLALLWRHCCEILLCWWSRQPEMEQADCSTDTHEVIPKKVFLEWCLWGLRICSKMFPCMVFVRSCTHCPGWY